MTTLSNQQKAEIGMIARQAYQAWPGREAFEECNPELSASACFAAWRHVEQGKACGRQSLRLCNQDDFLRLRAHFRALLGHGGAAVSDLLRHQEEPRIRARWKLQRALEERGLEESYAAAICRRQFKCALADASEKQLWNLYFTVTNRRQKQPQFKARRIRVKATAGALSVSDGDPF